MVPKQYLKLSSFQPQRWAVKHWSKFWKKQGSRELSY